MDYLNNMINSLTAQFGNKIPTIVGAIAVLIIGFFVAGVIRRLVQKLMNKTSIDDKIAAKMNTSFSIGGFVAKLVYYLVVIYTLMIVLNILGVDGVLEPLQEMLNKFIGYLPNIIGAGVITFAGYIIASIGSEATGFLSERLEAFGDRIGLDAGSIDLTKIVKQVVFIILFLPLLIVALDTLNMQSISQPATELLSSLLNAIPQILAAVILLAVFYIVGKYVVTILTDLLKNLGVDDMANKLGLSKIMGNTSLAGLIGNAALFFIMFTGVIAAADKLGLGQVEVILNDIMNIAGRVFFGIIILLAGVVISNMASSALSKSEDNGYLVPIAKFAILGIFLAFSLSTMGIADSIVNLAFGLTLGAVAVAFALSFGLGGKEAAGNQMKKFFDKMNK